jgi:hypothetical protein
VHARPDVGPPSAWPSRWRPCTPPAPRPSANSPWTTSTCQPARHPRLSPAAPRRAHPQRPAGLALIPARYLAGHRQPARAALTHQRPRHRTGLARLPRQAPIARHISRTYPARPHPAGSPGHRRRPSPPCPGLQHRPHQRDGLCQRRPQPSYQPSRTGTVTPGRNKYESTPSTRSPRRTAAVTEGEHTAKGAAGCSRSLADYLRFVALRVASSGYAQISLFGRSAGAVWLAWPVGVSRAGNRI